MSCAGKYTSMTFSYLLEILGKNISNKERKAKEP